MKYNRGFTIIELVTVIVLVGVLSVTIAPRFTGSDSYKAHSYRVHLISALRLTQQRAMQQTDIDSGYCHQIIFDDIKSRYGVVDRVDCTETIFPNEFTPDATGFSLADGDDIHFEIVGKANPSAVSFDSLGRPISNASLVNDCADGCLINVISNVETLQIKIEKEGFIHAL